MHRTSSFSTCNGHKAGARATRRHSFRRARSKRETWCGQATAAGRYMDYSDLKEINSILKETASANNPAVILYAVDTDVFWNMDKVNGLARQVAHRCNLPG